MSETFSVCFQPQTFPAACLPARPMEPGRECRLKPDTLQARRQSCERHAANRDHSRHGATRSCSHRHRNRLHKLPGASILAWTIGRISVCAGDDRRRAATLYEPTISAREDRARQIQADQQKWRWAVRGLATKAMHEPEWLCWRGLQSLLVTPKSECGS